MITVCIMRVVMHPAIPVIDEMCCNNTYNRGDQQNGMISKKNLLQYQESYACRKKYYGCFAMVMPFITMPQRIAPYYKCQNDHPYFKRQVFDNIYPKHRQCSQKQRKHRTMNSA